MSTEQKREYIAILGKLAIRRQAEVDMAAFTIYAEDLERASVPVADLEKACWQISRQPREEFKPAFPDLGVLLKACRELRDNRELLALPARDYRDEPLYLCPQCQDEPTGLILLRCTGLICERQKPHAPHTFAVKCPHWLRTHADRIRQNAEDARGKNKPICPNFYALADLMAGRYTWVNAKTLNAQEADTRELERQEATR